MSEREDRSRLSEIMQVLRRYRITKGITPVKVREILEELGPTYVKLGQILSIRTDLISSEYCKELQKLRSQVSPMPYDEVRAVLYEAYKKDPEDVFASIVKTPIGSASIAQVHEAFLKSGEHVVLKVHMWLINIHIDEGEFVFILGHSGAGKSTFLKLIQMEEKPTEGKIYINDQDLTTIKRRKVPYLRRQMGAVFQDFRLIPTMTVYENVAFAMRVTNINNKTIKNRVPFALSLVGLEDKMDRLPDELSGGEQQRVAVARALAHGPKLIIADEPTGNIDPEMSMDIMQLFEAINKVHITVVVVTHEHELVHKLAAKYNNRIITLANGHVASDTAHPEVAQEYEEWLAARQNDDEYEYED